MRTITPVFNKKPKNELIEVTTTVADDIFTSPVHMLQEAKHTSKGYTHDPLNRFLKTRRISPLGIATVRLEFLSSKQCLPVSSRRNEGSVERNIEQSLPDLTWE